MAQAKLIGARRLLRKLDRLQTKVTKRILRTPMNRAAAVIVKSVRAKVRQLDGFVWKSIGSRGRTYQQGTIHMRVIGPRVFTNPVRFGSHQLSSRAVVRRATILEFGTADKSPKPFLRPGLDDARQEAVRVLSVEIGRAITEEAKKG